MNELYEAFKHESFITKEIKYGEGENKDENIRRT